MNQLFKITEEFQLVGEILEITPFGGGLINYTYRVTLKDATIQYILQRINHHIFKDVDMLQNNIKRITDHIRYKLIEADDTDVERKTITLISTLDEKLYHFDDENYWRMMILIPESFTFDEVTPEYSYSSGVAFGEFQKMLSDLPGEPLGETIPDFHNIEFRLKQFKDALLQNVANRAESVKDLINEIENRADEMMICQKLYAGGKLPKRINHCDTKVNNILFDKDGKVLCVIDLDTTMPGFVISDIGDFMRTAGNTGKEDDTNLDNVSFNVEIFKAYTEGYLTKAKEFLTPLEIELLPFGAKLMTYMQLVRFLTDYLNGDTYYKINNPLHNLQRSNAQFKLLQSIESNYVEMQEFINLK